MNWKEQLTEIEKDFGFHKEIDWKPAIELVKQLLAQYPDNVELNVRAIYMLHNILVEEEYPEGEWEGMSELLQRWLHQSREKFSDNAEYLFFVGKILYIAEWYFGLDDDELAFEFQKKAMNKEPDNLLYRWAYRMSCSYEITGNYIDEKFLAHQIIENEKDKVEWLETKGFPGEYVLGHLKASNEKYLEKLSSI